MDTVTKEEVDTLRDMFKEMEAEIVAIAPILENLRNAEKDKKEKKFGFSKATEDIILKDFLKSL